MSEPSQLYDKKKARIFPITCIDYIRAGEDENSKSLTTFIKDQITPVSNRLTSAESGIKINTQKISSNTSKISEIEVIVRDNSNNISKLETDILSNSTNISNNSKLIETNKEDIKTLNDKLNTTILEGVAKNKADIAENRNNIDNNIKSISEIQTLLSTITDIANELKKNMSILKRYVRSDINDLSTFETKDKNPGISGWTTLNIEPTSSAPYVWKKQWFEYNGEYLENTFTWDLIKTYQGEMIVYKYCVVPGSNDEPSVLLGELNPGDLWKDLPAGSGYLWRLEGIMKGGILQKLDSYYWVGPTYIGLMEGS